MAIDSVVAMSASSLITTLRGGHKTKVQLAVS